MLSFLIYEGKVAVALAVFYMFYRLLLKKETFHRFNRFVLVGTVVLSFVLPLCIITIHKSVEMTAAPVGSVAVGELVTTAPVAATTPWWPMALIILFWAGVTFVLIRELISVFSIDLIIRLGQQVREEDGCKIVVTDQEIAPLSWMRYIILSRKDWDGPHAPILAHEKAHVAYGHSVELLLVDILAAFQWFNPAIWMLRADLQELHEYEADDAVLRSGVDLKDYQYLLIRKAVGKSGYSVANSFNHSILKNRITMMSKSKSPRRRGLRVLYLLPLVCLGLGLQARTVYVPKDEDNNNIVADADDVKKNVTINVDAEGRIVIEGKEIPLNGIADYLRSLGIPGAEIGVSIEQVQDTPQDVMTGLHELLRQAGVRKVQQRAFASTPLFILRSSLGEEKEISKEEFASLDPGRIVSENVYMDPDTRERYGEKAQNGVVIVNYIEDEAMYEPFSGSYYLTPFEFSTLVIIDMDGNRITDFRSQPTMTAGQDEFLGLYVSENPKKGPAEYVVRPVGGKPIKTIQWSSLPAAQHILHVNGKSPRSAKLSYDSYSTGNPAVPVVRVKSGAGEPLVIIDGKRSEIGVKEIGDIDPATIASMEVLKDSTAIAKYGPEAKNGVIQVITTNPRI